MDEERRFKVGDLVDARHWDHGVHYQDGVITRVLNPEDDNFSKKYAYYVVHACNPEMGYFFTEEGVKLRSVDDAWRVGHYYLDDLVRADDGVTFFQNAVIEKFVADADRPYKVTDRTATPYRSAFFGDAHLKLKYRSPSRPERRLQDGDWVVADDGNFRMEDAVIGPYPQPHTIPGRLEGEGEHAVYAADESGNVRLYREEHLRPRTRPVPQELRDPDGRIPDYKWFHNAPARARSKAAAELNRQWLEARGDQPSSLRYIKPEPPKRPIVSGFRGVLMWFTAVPAVTYGIEAQAPGVGEVVGLILVISSLIVVPLIADRRW